MKKLITWFTLFFMSLPILSTNTFAGDSKKYAICYGEMTKFHKRTKLHETNRRLSIEIKEKVCECYSKGKIDEYIGKVGC